MDLTKILDLHEKWLDGDSDGVRANLRGADLRRANLRRANLSDADLSDADLSDADLSGADLSGANLRDADLRGANLRSADLRGANLRDSNLRDANLDFSCLPLWCGSLKMNVDRRISAQIAYHFCSLQCDDPEVKEFQKSLYAFANEFHRVGEVPRLYEEDKP